jgi:type IV secretory pathway VirB10-like protein
MIIGLSFEITRSPKVKVLLNTLEKVMAQQAELNQMSMQPPIPYQEPPMPPATPEPAPNAFPPTKIPVLTGEELEAKQRKSAAAKRAAATRKKNKKAAEAAKADTTTTTTTGALTSDKLRDSL